MSTENILEVQSVEKKFAIRGGVFYRTIGHVHAVSGVSLKIPRAMTVGVVGESGCGKTTLARTLARLCKPTSGQIIFDGQDITKMTRKELQPIRREVQMVFQDPYESLNARHSIQEILKEPFKIHNVGTKSERREKIAHLMERVGLNPQMRRRYPHEFSGGQRQRIGIARALCLNPKLVICDEPVSALDVSIQSEILNLFVELQKELGLTYLFIAHNLSVVKHISDYIAVMYLGKVVEYAAAKTLYEQPLHPYTKVLLGSIPDLNFRKKKITTKISGEIPSPITPPSGCRFHTRCPVAKDLCKQQEPQLKKVEGLNTEVACHFAGE